jgi:hypothetical protein
MIPVCFDLIHVAVIKSTLVGEKTIGPYLKTQPSKSVFSLISVMVSLVPDCLYTFTTGTLYFVAESTCAI